MLLTTLPDITSDHVAPLPATLQWVGMEGIAVPVTLQFQGRRPELTAATAAVYVSLDTPTAKGIHMSRLHGVINHLAEKPCTKATLDQLLRDIIDSQNGIGFGARIKLEFNVLLKKGALLSDESGYQLYPVTIDAEMTSRGCRYEFSITIPYSSTCPCSASLARQLYSTEVDRAFPGEKIDKRDLLEWVQSEAGSVATPHSQRSYAYIKLAVDTNDWPDLPGLIFEMEEIIGTPVQTAVKRSDEQEFARLNANNLMFCEDAARRVKSRLEAMDQVTSYWFKIEHQESLHAHNAVVIDQGDKHNQALL